MSDNVKELFPAKPAAVEIDHFEAAAKQLDFLKGSVKGPVRRIMIIVDADEIGISVTGKVRGTDAAGLCMGAMHLLLSGM